MPNMKLKSKFKKRLIRHKRIRAKVSGTKTIPRLTVFRSSRHLQLQLIDDINHKTLLGLTDFSLKKGTKSEHAKSLGKVAAKKILDAGIKNVVFDRSGFQYHGRIKVLAEALREGGLKF